LDRRKRVIPKAIAVSGLHLASIVGSYGGSPPARPSDDSVVLERLPATPFSRSQLALVREELAKYPENIQLVTAAANSYIKLGKSTGDPRYFGYARAALEKWWDAPDPPIEVARFRAVIKGREHNYNGAIDDLKIVLDREPTDAQAWVDLANYHRVKGDYALANEAADQLASFGTDFQNAVCRGSIMVVTGSAREAYDLLGGQLAFARQEFPGSVSWLLVMQGNIARILGEFDGADRHFQEALQQDVDDRYARRAYGDFLLRRDRPEEALKVLGEPSIDNGALVLATIAAERSGNRDMADTWEAILDDRFRELRLRGGEPHGRFEAQVLLEVKNDPAGALEISLANWDRQKEAEDSRNVLAAALASGDRDAAQPVIDFLRSSKTEDRELLELVEQLEGR